jgi:threonine/homoserine/homoserine lactone efflux protein
MIMVQAYIAVFISKFLYRNPEVIDILLKIAIAIFAFFAIYFFIVAKQKKEKKLKKVNLSKKNSFFKGVLLAALNLLTIPYYSGLNAMWNEAGWIKFEAQDITTFVVAAGTGTFAVLYLYTFYFDKLETKTNRFSKNSNYILSALMLLLLIITLMRILYR